MRAKFLPATLNRTFRRITGSFSKRRADHMPHEDSNATPADDLTTDESRTTDGDDSQSKYDPGKAEMIRFTYEQVLDATKHQDDKIGRLLTVVAFLTAGALALANLGSAKKTSAVFVVPPVNLPLGTICLTFFLLAIFMTVILLVTSFATPLRLPGREPKKERTKQTFVRDVETSQIYFSEIAKVSLDEWDDKWGAPEGELQNERFQSMIRETHNLSVRTNFKYDRTTEAVSVFSVALLFFGLAVSFACLATVSHSSGEPADPIHITVMGRLLLTLALSTYTGVHLVSRIRYNFQSFDEHYPESHGALLKARMRADRVFAIVFPTTIGAIVFLTPEWPGKIWSVCIVSTLCLVSVGSLILRSWKDPKSTEEKQLEKKDERRQRVLKIIWRIVAASIPIILLGGASAFATITGEYGIQLLTSVSAVCILLLLGALSPMLLMRRNLNSYIDKMKEKERNQKVNSQTSPELQPPG